MRVRLVFPVIALACSGLLFVGLHLRENGGLAAPHNPLTPATVSGSESDPSALVALVAPSPVGERAREKGTGAPRSTNSKGKTGWLEVVDPQGRPAANVPVVRASAELRSGWRNLGVTGRDGYLELPRPQTPDAGLVVAAKLGLGDLRSSPMEIPPAAFAAGQVTRLTLPLGTGLELRLVGAEHNLLDVPGDAKLSMRRHWRKASLSGGRARFDALLPGEEMRASLQLGTGGPRFSEKVKASTTLGEHREIDFSIGVRTLIRTRLIGAGGRPLVNTRFVARLLGQDTSPELKTYRTDGAGRCMFLVKGPVRSGPISLDIQVRTLRGTTIAVRKVEIPSLPRGRVLSLGDIRVRATDLLASGLVLDAEGRPALSSRVSVDVRSAEDGEWTPASELGMQPSRTGRFSVQGLSDSRSLRLWARAEGHYDSEPVICERGETNVRLALRGLGSLSPTIDWSWGNPGDFFDFRLTRGGRRVLSSGMRRGRYQDLQPGSYELTVELRGTDRLMLRLPDLEVPIGGPCMDARLHPIRLDGLLSIVKLTVLDAEGSPIANAAAGMTDRVRPNGRGTTWRADPEDGWRIAIPTPLQGSLTVLASGCQPVQIPPPLGDQTLTLRWLSRVVLRLPAALDADWDGELLLSSEPLEWSDPTSSQFVILLSGEDPPPWRLLLSADEVDGRVIHPPRPGSYHATWLGVQPEEPRQLGSSVFLVPDDGGTVEIVLPMPRR